MPHINEACYKNEIKNEPVVTFGLFTDIQYADIDDDGINYVKKRYYRNGINAIKNATHKWKSISNFKFIIQLGDLIDGKSKGINDSIPAMQRVLNELNRLFEDKAQSDTPNLLHIWGNHEFYNFKRDYLIHTELNTAKCLNQNLETKANYYTFKVTDKLKLVCLDFYDFSCLGYDETSDEYKKAYSYLTTHNKNSDLDLVDGLMGNKKRLSLMNGSLSDEQLKWLVLELVACEKDGYKTILCGHIPCDPRTCVPDCLAWNYKELLEIMWKFNKTVIAYFSGR